jgi:hypothetical protein
MAPESLRARGTHMSPQQVRECLAVLAEDAAAAQRQPREGEEKP